MRNFRYTNDIPVKLSRVESSRIVSISLTWDFSTEKSSLPDFSSERSPRLPGAVPLAPPAGAKQPRTPI